MRIALLAGVALLNVASAASAEGVGHKGTEFTLGYDSWSMSSFLFGPTSFDGTTTIARIRTDWGFGPHFGAQLNLDYSEFDFDGGFEKGSATTFALHPYWEQSGSFRAGAFYQHTELANDTGAMNYYGLEGMFTPNEALSWEFYLGKAEIEDSSGFDITAYGTTLSYAMSEKLALHIAYDREDIEQGSSSANNSRFNMGLDYSFGGNGKMPPITLTAEAGTVDIFGLISLDVVGAKLTIPLGATAGANGRKLFRERGIYWAVGGVASGGIF